MSVWVLDPKVTVHCKLRLVDRAEEIIAHKDNIEQSSDENYSEWL